jgi:hypothetical protein
MTRARMAAVGGLVGALAFIALGCTAHADPQPGSAGYAVKSFYDALQAKDCATATSLLTAETRFRVPALIGEPEAMDRYCGSLLKGRTLVRTVVTNEQPLAAPGVQVVTTLQFANGNEEIVLYAVQECGQWKLIEPGRKGI